MSTRQKFDMKRPDARRISDEIVHGAFITEGTMVAFPTCFPAVTVPVPADESRIRALDVMHGVVYAGTSGRAAHLLVGMFHGVTGMVFDMGKIDGATDCPAIVCGQARFVAAANGPSGGRLIARNLQPLPFDLIQEWHISRTPFTEIGQEVLRGEKILHMVGDGENTAIGITPSRLFSVDIQAGSVADIAAIPGTGRLARGARGIAVGKDEGLSLWRYDFATRTIDRHAIPLPQGDWNASQYWARDPIDGTLYTTDAQGRLFALRPDGVFTPPLAQLPHPPGGPMAVTFDGRLFGTYGEGMSMLFCFNPQTRQIKSLGVPVSFLERRRYGYSFAAAVVGRDGELYFGEDDDLGHLWIYFPSIQRRQP